MTNHKILLKDCDIFEEVDLEKNKDINFDTLAYRSAKKIWWKCKKEGHSFIATCHHRSRGSKCPGCSKYSRYITYEKSLRNLKPDLAKLWHPTKNGKLKPEEVSASTTSSKFWFICNLGHEFLSTTNNKKNNKYLCPYCSKRLPSNDYNFEKNFPLLIKEWDFKKNKELPSNFTPHSNSKVWWLCKKGHSYKQAIKQKTTNYHGCNICNSNISKPQIRIFTELNYIFKNIEFNKRFNNIEIDVFLPDVKIGIEYDGEFYHKDKVEKDLEKNKKLLDFGINLIRIREKSLKKLSQNDILLKRNNLKKIDIDHILKKINYLINSDKYDFKINQYLLSTKFLNEKKFNQYVLDLPFPLLEKSLEFIYPDLCKEWDFKKNIDLTPRQFLPSNHTKVWWICKKYGHEWKASISDRTYKNAGCRICAYNDRNNRFKNINKSRKGVKKSEWKNIQNKRI